MAKGLMVLYGKNSVYERLKADPESVRSVMMSEGFDHSETEGLIRKNKIPFERVSARELEKIRPAKDLQGIVVKVDGFRYIDFEDVVGMQGESLIPIFLDRVNDPHNLGVIIRIAACFGSFAVIIPEHESCEVNETVLHVACGGENYVKVAKVVNLSKAIIDAKKNGFWIVGADVDKEAQDVGEVSLPFPLGLVMGSEGEGIRQGIQKHLDIKARIPMKGTALSFNVGMACAIFCYEILRQKEKTK